jgi:hypothetical protein
LQQGTTNEEKRNIKWKKSYLLKQLSNRKFEAWSPTQWVADGKFLIHAPNGPLL